jgi:hypothetical protein
MTETTLRDLERELEAIYAQCDAHSTPADLDGEAIDAYWRAPTAREFELSQQVATAPIASLEDTVSKLRLARRVHLEMKIDDEDLDSYEGIAARCVRQVLEWLEAMAVGLPQIRAALLAALQRHGGDLEEDDEPGLDERTRDLKAQLRGAIKLLDQAAPPL